MTSRFERPDRFPSPRTAQAGLTLVELMVTLVIGMIVVGAMSALFIGSTTTRREVDSAADTIENGRYTIDVLTRELSLAGYYGTLRSPSGNDTTKIPCSTSVADWKNSLGIYVMGWNDDAGSPACLTDRKANTDAIFIQRVSTCSLGEADCGAETAADAYVQASECTCVGLSSCTADTTSDVIDKGTSGSFTLRTKKCDSTKPAQVRRIIRRFYYVNSNDVLVSRDVSLTGIRDPVPLAENVEQLQFSYAVDANGNGSIEDTDTFKASPAAGEWASVLGVRVWILTRSNTQDDKPTSDWVFDLDGYQVKGKANDKTYRRRISTTYIPFNGPTWRALPPA
ncbi:MAG: PilW family protein [Proteobacteria bacterium]|nr:PilW family protein [Pseudomonadota bacterium]